MATNVWSTCSRCWSEERDFSRASRCHHSQLTSQFVRRYSYFSSLLRHSYWNYTQPSFNRYRWSNSKSCPHFSPSCSFCSAGTLVCSRLLATDSIIGQGPRYSWSPGSSNRCWSSPMASLPTSHHSNTSCADICYCWLSEDLKTCKSW